MCAKRHIVHKLVPLLPISRWSLLANAIGSALYVSLNTDRRRGACCPPLKKPLRPSAND